EGDQGLVADVVDLVRNARLDEDEIARFVFNRLLQALAVGVPHTTLDDEEHHLEAVVNVGVGDAPGRHRRDVDRQGFRPSILAREPLLVIDTVPGSPAAAAAKHGDAVEILDLLHLGLVSAGDWCGHTWLPPNSSSDTRIDGGNDRPVDK